MSRLLFALALLTCFLCSGIASAADEAAAPISSLREVWAHDCAGPVEDVCNAGGIAYFSTIDAFGALDLATGKPLWQKSIKRIGFGANLDCAGGTLYASVGEYKLLACDAKTGKERWSIKRKGYSAPIRVYGDTLFGELQSGTLAAVDLKTKRTRWAVKIDSSTLAAKVSRDTGLAAKPILIGKRLYVGSKAGEVICLSAASGKIVWRYKIPVPAGETNVSACGLALDSRRVYATHDCGGIVALDIDTGKRLWSASSRDQVQTAPCVFGSLVVFSSMDGYLYALRTADGSQAWKAEMCKSGMMRSSAPLVDSHHVLISIDDALLAFDAVGNQLWFSPLPVPDLGGAAIQLTKNGLLMLGHPWVGLVAEGKPDQPPSDPAARVRLAQDLASRMDKLTRNENRMLISLGDEGFAAMLPVVRDRLATYMNANAGKASESLRSDSFKQYERFDAAVKILLALATPKHTPELLALWQDLAGQDAPLCLTDWLVRLGDEQALLPFCLSVMQEHKAGGEPLPGEEIKFNLALSIFAKSSDPRAVAFMIEKLRDPNADPQIRHVAFDTLAHTGGDAGASAVIAAKDTVRTIPSIESHIKLDKLPFALSDGEPGSPTGVYAELLEVKSDLNGVKWGLIGCPAAGSGRDLWIAKQENGKWANLLFTGRTDTDMKGKDWLTLTIDKALAKDTDGDGWTDALEARMGTNPNVADTDGDGLKDSEDKNPLAAHRALGETEQVLAATFEARFRFSDEAPLALPVYVPDNLQPFELMGRDWVTLCRNIKDKPRPVETGRRSQTRPNASFRPPEYAFDMSKVYEANKDNVVLWNSDKTEAKTHIVVYYGSLSATGFDVRLKKIQGVWIVVEMQMMWIS